MRVYWTLTRRELAGFFVSIAGYVTIAAALFLMGESFLSMLASLRGLTTDAPITEVFFRSVYFWFLLLVAGPVITMRLFAVEKFSGTFETLMTAPVGDLQVVLAKFTAGMVFYLLMWLPALGILAIIRHYIADADVFDPGLLGSTVLGMTLLGGLFISLGCFASSLTKNQIVAATISLSLGFSLLLLSFLPESFKNQNVWWSNLLSQVSLKDHMLDFSRGLVDTRALVFYVTLTFLFLFLTLRVVESRRWK